METVLIVIHLMVVIALVVVVLLQRSEGGALGMGGGGGGGNFMSARGAANTLTRATAFLAAAFFATSIALGVLAKISDDPSDILDRVPVEVEEGGPSILDQITPEGADDGAVPPAPATDEPAAPTGQ